MTIMTMENCTVKLKDGSRVVVSCISSSWMKSVIDPDDPLQLPDDGKFYGYAIDNDGTISTEYVIVSPEDIASVEN